VQSENSASTAYDTPNLIVIMNESWADYANIGQGIEMSEDCMPFIRSLTENTIKGTAYSSVFGGNTANSEYEFLTGNTMGFLPPSSVGFNLFVRGEMPSLASEYKSIGYNTLAIHPYRGTNYRRNIVYPQIGFDTYYTRTDFYSPQYIRKYISDQTLFDRIIEEYEKNLETGEPIFSYNVTVQNHGDYLKSSSKNLDDSIQILTKGIDTTRTGMHTNLVKATDEAFENLVEYFSGREEPVVIVMFGDHQANLGDSTYEYLIGNEEDLTAEELMEKYKVPFIAWANYDIQEETIEKTSLNYLYSILASRLDLPMTGYQKYLLDLSEEIPVLAAGGYWGANGEFYELDDEDSPYFDKVNEYNILEYNYIFGKSNRDLELFGEISEGSG
jgi:phosphoglycerol transferase MdoB-like AlkP superfamily enzyme